MYYAKIKNEIVFPIIVKDANLEVDNMDVEKYLQAFNQQNPSEQASNDIHQTISKSLENGFEKYYLFLKTIHLLMT